MRPESKPSLDIRGSLEYQITYEEKDQYSAITPEFVNEILESSPNVSNELINAKMLDKYDKNFIEKHTLDERITIDQLQCLLKNVKN